VVVDVSLWVFFSVCLLWSVCSFEYFLSVGCGLACEGFLYCGWRGIDCLVFGLVFWLGFFLGLVSFVFGFLLLLFGSFVFY